MGSQHTQLSYILSYRIYICIIHIRYLPMFVLPDGQVLSVVVQQSVASAPDVVVVDAARMMTIDLKNFMMYLVC